MEPSSTNSQPDLADVIRMEVKEYYESEFKADEQQNQENLELSFPNLMLDGRAFTAKIANTYYSHTNPEMEEPRLADYHGKTHSQTGDFELFKEEKKVFLEHPDTILVPKGSAVIDLDLDTRCNGFYAQMFQMEDIASLAKERKRIRLYKSGVGFNFFPDVRDSRDLPDLANLPPLRRALYPGERYFNSVVLSPREAQEFGRHAAALLDPPAQGAWFEFENEDLNIEMSVVSRPQGSQIRVSLISQGKHMSSLKRYLAEDRNVFFCIFNSMIVRDRIAQLYVDLETLFETKPLFKKLLDLWDPHHNFNAMIAQGLLNPLPEGFEERIMDLNDSQKRAIRECWTSSYYHLVIGPPGTGKSRMLTKFLEIAHAEKKKVLVCSMNNSTVDTLMKYFIDTEYFLRFDADYPHNNSIIRGGNPYAVDKRCLYYRVGNCIDTYMLDKNPEEAEDEFHSIRMIFCTLSGTYALALKDLVKRTRTEFDYIVVDEAATCAHPYVFMAMSMGAKLIMAGDHNQLCPMIKDPLIKDRLEVSLFERLLKCEAVQRINPPISSMLTLQYRMHHLIAEPSSIYYYFGVLESHESNRERTLFTGNPDLLQGRFVDRETPIMWIDHQGPEIDREINPVDAKIVGLMIKDLLAMGVHPLAIGVICAYKRQIAHVSDEIDADVRDDITVATIDSFQGAERDVIIISTSRSNEESQIGFLHDERRINVAITRARKLCIFVGNSRTLIHNQKKYSLKSQFLGAVLRFGKYLFYDHEEETFSRTAFPAFFRRRFPRNDGPGGDGFGGGPGHGPGGGPGQGGADESGNRGGPPRLNFYARSFDGRVLGGGGNDTASESIPANPNGSASNEESSRLDLETKKRKRIEKRQRHKQQRKTKAHEDKLAKALILAKMEDSDSLAAPEQSERDADALSTASKGSHSALLANCLKLQSSSESSSSSESEDDPPQGQRKSRHPNRGRQNRKHFRNNDSIDRNSYKSIDSSFSSSSTRERKNRDQRSSRDNQIKEVYNLRGKNANRGRPSNHQPPVKQHFDTPEPLYVAKTQTVFNFKKKVPDSKKPAKTPTLRQEEDFPKLV